MSGQRDEYHQLYWVLVVVVGDCDCILSVAGRVLIYYSIFYLTTLSCVCVINMFDGDLMMSVVGGWWGIWYSIDIIIYLAKRV